MTRVILHAGSWLLVVAAILLGVAGAAIAILAAVAVTGGRTLAAVAGALAVVLCTGWLSWLAARRRHRCNVGGHRYGHRSPRVRTGSELYAAYRN